MRISRGSITLEAVTGDIARQDDLDAVVNAANAELMPGGGVAGALHRAAGPGLAEECRPLAPIEPGQAMITGAHGLPNRYVVHALGPVYGRDQPSDALLASCYRNALRRCEESGVRSVGFPALSAGAFGYPLEAATQVAVQTVDAQLAELDNVAWIRFVLFDDATKAVYRRAFEELEG